MTQQIASMRHEKGFRVFNSTWWQKGDWIVVRPLSGFHAMCDTDLWPPCNWLCGYRNGLEKMKIRRTIDLFRSILVNCYASRWSHGAGLDPWLFSPASLSWKDWVNDSIQSLDHGTGNPKRHTVTSFLLSLFRDLILLEPLENGKETSLFLLDWEECGTALMVFAGLARLRSVCPFSSEAGM